MRQAPLAMSADEFRALGHWLVDRVAAQLAAIPLGRVAPGEPPAAVREALGGARPLPAEGVGAEEALKDAADLLFRHSTYNAHPRFFAYITSSPAPIGMLGDLLAAAVNANVGGWKLSPMASEMEAQTVRWIAELIGYPAGCGGLLVSGGNMANMVCFMAARAARAGWDVRRRGHAEGPRLAVYASSETHTWIQKAADLCGVGTDMIRWIAVDARQRMVAAELRSAIRRDQADGIRPLLAVGTAGSVSTGAVDPLPDVADVCAETGVWFHVDGAYGGLAAQVPGAPADLPGLARADSAAVDPHKWLYAPLEAGCALVRRPEDLRGAFAYHPAYYNFDEGQNFFDYGPQNSRGFRALKVWLGLRQAGRSGYLQMIGEDIALSRRLFERVQAHPELEALTHGLSIATFRYVPRDLRGNAGAGEYLNELNRALLGRIEQGGQAFLSNAVVDGAYALRACIVNFHTSADDVDALPDLIAACGRELHAEMGGAALGPGGEAAKRS
jgi:glutamate/tyrosine decarboxylase-like PLP-dependent enzyme